MKFNLFSQSIGQFESTKILVLLAVLVIASSARSPAQTLAHPAPLSEITASQPGAYPAPRCRYDVPSYEAVNPCYGADLPRAESFEPRYYFFLPNPSTETVARQFVYRVTLTNNSGKTVKSLDWDYILIDPDTQQEVALHRFTTQQTVRHRKRKTIAEHSPSPPTKVISLRALIERSAKPFMEKVIIRRVIYADGSVWLLSASPQ